VLKHNVPLLVVIGDAPFPTLAISFVATRGRILDFLAKNQPPYIAKVYRPAAKEAAADASAPGRIERWYP
jgi:hypothetical protein